MFIKYQKVRNAVVGTTTAIVGGVAAFFGLHGGDPPAQSDVAQTVATRTDHSSEPTHAPTQPVRPPARQSKAISEPAPEPVQLPPAEQQTSPPQRTSEPSRPARRTQPIPSDQVEQTDQQRYAAAMAIALSAAHPSGKGKDVLGSSSLWKLNLYDDNKDGQWDRGKLDTNRDEVDDERWNYKNGRWEKDGGLFVWTNKQWVSDAAARRQTSSSVPASHTAIVRYQAAMELALGPADSSGKGKDVLGPASPWKLNLYDDNRDGQWDRGKLDTNRDEVDDEKWNYKNGRWEKDGGNWIWANNEWVVASSTRRDKVSQNATDASVSRYQAAMAIALGAAHPSGKGKDVLGSSSPWKLNLYDDDKDGQWDRGKLDTNRDEVDDEKWNYKKGRWEKDGGATIWNGNGWESSNR